MSAAPWASGAAYQPGDLVSYGGRVYRCLQGHTSLPTWTPDATPALWVDTGLVACGSCATSTGSTGSSSSSSSSSSTSSSSGGGSTGGGGTSGTTGASGMLFVGYFQTWSEGWQASGAQTTLARLPAYVNVVNLSFMKPDATYTAGSLSLLGTGIDVPYDGPTLKDAVAALHASHPDTRVLISVGGATYTNWAGFNAQAVADLVGDLGLDGVDLDYEPSSPNCSASGGTVSCPSDAEYVGLVDAMRSAMPRPLWLSIAAFSVGAYGEGAWANATPQSPSTGIALAVLRDANASAALDLVNVMSYDASPAYDPLQALQAYQHYFPGRISMGIEVPPEAWGGHVETVSEIDALAAAVTSSGAAGLMLWSLQKPSQAQQFSTEICTHLGLPDCSAPLP